MRRRFAAFLGTGLALFFSGCLGEFTTPPAYKSQRYFCGDSDLDDFQSMFASCRGNDVCVGVFSLRGILEAEPLTFTSLLTDSSLGLVAPQGAPDRYYDILRMTGASPYFQFSLHMHSIGGIVGQDFSRRLNLNGGARTEPSPLTDFDLDAGLTLQASSQSEEESGFTGSGSFDFSKLSDTELRASFHGTFGDIADVNDQSTVSDDVDGCFIVVPKLTAINPAPL